MDVDIPAKFGALYEPKRLKIYYGGRGGRKSWEFARALLIIGAKSKKLILCTREYQGSILDSVHRLLSNQIELLGLDYFYTVEKSKIYGVNGTEFIFEGLKNNVTKIKSLEGADYCWAEEAESIGDFSWDVLIPTIRKPGSEIWVSFNPQNEDDPTYQLFVANPRKDSVVQKVGWQDNPDFPDVLNREMEELKETNYPKYLHIWEGEFTAAFEGAYYSEEMQRMEDENRICTVPFQQGVVVNTFWDMGHSDLTVIWFHQKIGLEHRFIKCYANNQNRLEHYAKYVKEQPYLYGSHYLPHDADYNQLSTSSSYKDMLKSMGLKDIVIVTRTQDVSMAIEETATKMSGAWMDKEGCKDGIKALKRYCRKFDKARNSFISKPNHDKYGYSDYADALRQWAQGYKGDNSEWFKKEINTNASWY